jgi:hypothetical protein
MTFSLTHAAYCGMSIPHGEFETRDEARTAAARIIRRRRRQGHRARHPRLSLSPDRPTAPAASAGHWGQGRNSASLQRRTNDMTLDTLAYAKQLEAAGVDRDIAEAHAKAMVDHVIPQLATSADIALLRSDLRDRRST